MEKRNFWEEIINSKELPLAITATIIITTTTFFIINKDNYKSNNNSFTHITKWIQSIVDSILKK